MLGLGLFAGLVLAILEWRDGFIASGIFNLAIGLICGAVFGMVGYIVSFDTTDELSHVEYKVIVSDEVNFTDFMEKYEIIDQEGQIYTVKERG